MSSVVIIAILWAALVGGVLELRRRGHRLRLPVATIVLTATITVVSVIGELNADVLNALGRDLERLQAGEWWRAVSPLVVQDGGWPGLIFNVIALFAVGAVAESLFRRWVVSVVFGTVGLVGELAAYTVFTGQGFAGNSVANLGLAGVLLMTAIFSTDLRARIAGVLGLAAGVVLLVMWDLHAVGWIAGAAIGLVIAIRPARYVRGPAKAPPHPE